MYDHCKQQLARKSDDAEHWRLLADAAVKLGMQQKVITFAHDQLELSLD